MSNRQNYLARRSELLWAVRRFFLERDFIEVETPLLADEVIPELHIEPVAISRDRAPPSGLGGRNRTTQWLQASPELHMKRLLAAGMNAIFQITRSFRAGEQGRLHRQEFTIVEWYRTGDDMHAGIALLDELLQSTMGAKPALRTSYAEVFQKHVGVNPHGATVAELAALGVSPPEGMHSDNRDEWLNLLLTTKVEPELGRDGPEIVYDYPASQAALARIVQRKPGGRVAERFELYWRGVELANGYHELTDAAELRERLVAVNRARLADGRACLPLPESLLSAMQQGLPACTGCALGFDRLAMLACDAESIDDMMAFPKR